MDATELATFRARLVSALTDADKREEARERKAGQRVNIYRMGHYLMAVDSVCEAIAEGLEPARAFARGFNPTRDMHRVAKTLGLPLDVHRGQWVWSY